MSRKIFTLFILVVLTGLVFGSVAQARWIPKKPITFIVPWGAGGSTDQVTRIVAGELEEKLGQKIVVVNQPGASGSVGTKTAMDARRDGYTWTAGGVMDLGVYCVLGFLDTKLEDWHLYLDVANILVISVHPDTPYQTFEDVVKGFKDKPGAITVATAGEASCGHIGIESISKHTGIDYRHVTYGGGNPAVIACVRGETDVVVQLACEQADMARAKRLRPLAALNDEPLELAGYGEIPPITNWIPEFKPIPLYFGVWVHKGVPEEVVNTLNELWEEVIANSKALKEYAKDRGAVFTPYFGIEALERSYPTVQSVAWLYYDAGKAEKSPITFGIPRP